MRVGPGRVEYGLAIAMRIRRLLLPILATVAVVLASAPAAGAVSAEEAVALYNAQRQANGIPGVASLSPALTDGCAKHVAYMKLNGYGHGETPGRPGYTPEGARLVPEAAGNEVLPGATCRGPHCATPGRTPPCTSSRCSSPT